MAVFRTVNSPSKFLTVERFVGVELRHHAIFRGDGQTVCRDIAIFWILKMAAAAVLDF